MSLLLVEVYCNDYAPDEAAAYVRVYNPGPEPAALAGCTLEWGASALRFPSGPDLAPGGSAYIAWDAGAFQQRLGYLPDFTLIAAPGVPALTAAEAQPPAAFEAAKGTVRLLGPGGEVQDAFAWGDIAAPEGWTGPALAPAEKGVVYRRAINENHPTADDCGSFIPGARPGVWRQGQDWMPRRLMRVGQGSFPAPSLDAASVTAFLCPDSSFEAIAGLIDAAAERIDVNMYILTQADLTQHLLNALERKVAVRMLIEGQPVGGLLVRARALLDKLQQAGARVQVLRATHDGFRRYHFDHAKYVVADGRFSLIMSDNWGNHSVPTTHLTGQRGWGIIVESPELTQHLTRVFDFDFNPKSPDSVPLEQFDDKGTLGAPDEEDQIALPDPLLPLHVAGPVNVALIQAPEHALLPDHGIPGAMRMAGSTIDVQQLSLPNEWGPGNSDPDAMPNLFLAEVLTAARRGVRVRVLLNGKYLHPQDPTDNTHMKEWLEALAAKDHLPIEVRILNFEATKMSIHNKGVIVDGRKVLISSINWSWNSPLNNREMALVVDSPEVARYYTTAFERDWEGAK